RPSWPPALPSLFPSPTLFRSEGIGARTLSALGEWSRKHGLGLSAALSRIDEPDGPQMATRGRTLLRNVRDTFGNLRALEPALPLDRKSTHLNSSHVKISYAVF